MGDVITNIANWWKGLSSGLRDNIIAGIVVAFLIGLFTIFRKSIAALFGNTGEWQSWLQRALQLGIQDTQLKANTLKAIGDVQQFRDDRDAALQSYHDALALFKAVGAKLGEANTRLAMARMNNVPDLYREAIALYTQIGDRYSLARGEYFYAVSLDETPDNRDLARKLLTDARLHWQAMDFEPGMSAVDEALAALDAPAEPDAAETSG